MKMTVGLRRLFAQDLSDEHLTMLNHAISSTSEATVEGWLTMIVDGTMGLYEFTGGPVGLIGFKRTPDAVWVEIITGRGLAQIAKQIPKIIRSLPEVGDQPLTMLVPNPRLERLYAWQGAKRLGVLMRYTGD